MLDKNQMTNYVHHNESISYEVSWESVAIKWLTQDAERERLSNDALMSEQARVALSANRAAWIAAITAIIMVVIDMVSRIIAYLA